MAAPSLRSDRAKIGTQRHEAAEEDSLKYLSLHDRVHTNIDCYAKNLRVFAPLREKKIRIYYICSQRKI